MLVSMVSPISHRTHSSGQFVQQPDRYPEGSRGYGAHFRPQRYTQVRLEIPLIPHPECKVGDKPVFTWLPQTDLFCPTSELLSSLPPIIGPGANAGDTLEYVNPTAVL